MGYILWFITIPPLVLVFGYFFMKISVSSAESQQRYKQRIQEATDRGCIIPNTQTDGYGEVRNYDEIDEALDDCGV